MSTKLRAARLSKISISIFVCLWAAACSLAWEKSTSSGGDYDAEAKQIAKEVAVANKLSTRCEAVARELAAASIRERVTRYRPTNRIMSERENRAIITWNESSCPDRALVGIAYGVSKVALQDITMRRQAGQ